MEIYIRSERAGPYVPLVPTLAPMIRHGVNVKVTPLRVHLYSKSNH